MDDQLLFFKDDLRDEVFKQGYKKKDIKSSRLSANRIAYPPMSK